MTKRIIAAAIILGACLPAFADTIKSGHVLGNGAATESAPTDTSLINVMNQSGSGLGANVATGLAQTATGTGGPVLGTSPTINTPNLVGDNLTVNPAARQQGPYIYYYAPYFAGVTGANPTASFGFELIGSGKVNGTGAQTNAAVINPGASICTTTANCTGDIDLIVWNGTSQSYEFYSLYGGAGSNPGGFIPDVPNRNVLGSANYTWKGVYADNYYVWDATFPTITLNSTTSNQSQAVVFQNAGTATFSILAGYAAGNYWSLYDNAYGQATIYQAAYGNLTFSPHGNIILNPASGYETTTPFLALGPASINYAGGTSTVSNSLLTATTYAYGSVTGTGVNGYLALESMSLSDAVQSGSNAYYVVNVIDQIAAGATGNRATILGVGSVSGTPGANLNAVGTYGLSYVNVNMGGSAGAYTNYVGSIFGGTSQVYGLSGATYLIAITGHEFDVEIPTGASAGESHAATFVHTKNHRVRATYDDSAIELDSQDDASNPGWKYGIAFGGYAHQWDFATDSTLIYAWTRQSGTASSSVAAIGIDFSNVTFGTAFLKSTGFLVDGSGNETTATLKVASIPTSAGGGGLYVCVDSTGATYKKASCP